MTDNLPDRVPETYGAGGVPLTRAPTAALAFALGYAVARPQSADMFGPFCAVVEELMSRRSGETDAGIVGGYDRRTEFGVIMDSAPPELGRAVTVLYQAQRGQRWARGGQSRRHS